jgi:hypothetical protein
MTKVYWDGASGYVECEIVYSGRGSMPHEERDRAYWRIKEDRLAQHGLDSRRSVPSYEEIRKCKAPPNDLHWNGRQAEIRPASAFRFCGCGRKITVKAYGNGQRRCYTCISLKRKMRKKVA